MNLNPVCIPHLRYNMTLMHDGAPANTARATRDLLQASRINILPWSSYSPDLNPIEHIWNVIGRKVRARDPRNVKELKRAVLGNGTYFSNLSTKSTCFQCSVGAGSSSTQTVDTQAFKWTFFFEDSVIDETRFPNKE